MPLDSSDLHSALLAQLTSREEIPPDLLLVVGNSGTGKTHWCLGLAESAQALGLAVGGVASPGVFAGQQKTAIELLDLGTYHQRRLAWLKGGPETGMGVGDWIFDPDVMRWGNDLLGALGACDLFIVDEIGPLEFNLEAGLTNAFEQVSSRRHHLTCLTLRPALLPRALVRWDWAHIYNMPAGEEAA
jgi:nucleoside-triphosphatase THEP1